MTTSPLIVCEGVTKRFGEVSAVNGVDLTIHEGEFFALLGPSGCGKTTLLRMMAGLEAPSSGRILIDGADMTDVPPHKRPVNMVFQSYALFPHMSVAENVGYGLKVSGVAASERQARVDEILGLVQLSGYGARKPDELSGGQRQRVALARALVKRPRVLLLDEPLSALDAKLREQMRFELTRIQAQIGITFVFVTHDQDEALSMASRCAVMKDGVMQQLGTPTELYEHPHSRFVADFIGLVNLFPGQAARTEADYTIVQCADLAAPVALHEANAAPAGGADLWVAIRPEKIGLHKKSSPPAEAGPAGCNQVAGTIRQISYLGSGSVYEVALPSGKLVKVSRPNPGPQDPARFAAGEEVWLNWGVFAPSLLFS